MYLFKLFLFLLLLFFILYLHSTMYLFKLPDLSNVFLTESIYIPLCIYLNCLQNQFRHPVQQDLHSTMYLFKHDFRICLPYSVRYLHSTMYLFKLPSISPVSITFHIYIPLCIYLNFNLIAMVIEVFTFTFHYVSI